MIKSHVVEVESKSRGGSHTALGEAFNAWVGQHPSVKFIHFFEPVRWEHHHGDSRYDTYHATMTFFYEPGPQYGLRELEAPPPA